MQLSFAECWNFAGAFWSEIESKASIMVLSGATIRRVSLAI
jgi:hypothetical protein